MREFLLRGKRTDNGEWVEGILFNAKEDTFIIPHGNEYSYDPIEGLAFDVYGCKVDPETVGQYTGLTDKNGNKIFEGDIVDYISSDVIGNPKTGTIIVEDMTDYDTMIYLNHSDELQIIGNIHDNPELLKGGGDNG